MNEKVERILRQQDVAYKHAPFGSWFKRWIPFVCKHDFVRCTHGDEIIGRKFRRRVCLECGRSLEGSIPEMCFFTGEPHPSHDKQGV